MTVASMTGFARAEGASGASVWLWELKSVNSKGLEIKIRLPPGLDMVEQEARRRLSAKVVRGTLFANLSVRREAHGVRLRVNEALLEQLIGLGVDVARRHGLPSPSVDGLLALKGVVEAVDEEDGEDTKAALADAVLVGLDTATDGLSVMRRQEGAALAEILLRRLDEISALTEAAERNPSRRPEAIRARLVESIETILGATKPLDPDRLHQEALLIAAKVDIREELDRLLAHVAAARKLIAEGGPVGRKLDFLAQEFNRETNTLCSKSNDRSLTAIGLDLKVVVEQFREQIQNLE